MPSCSRSYLALAPTPGTKVRLALPTRARVPLPTASWPLATWKRNFIIAIPVLGVPKPQITCFTRRWQPFCQCTEKRTPNTNHSSSLPWSRLAACGFVCPGSPITFEKLAWEAVTRCIVPPSGLYGNRNFQLLHAESRLGFRATSLILTSSGLKYFFLECFHSLRPGDEPYRAYQYRS